MQTRYLILVSFASLLAPGLPPDALAASADVQIGVEGGAATLARPDGRRGWGHLGAIHATLGVTDRLSVRVLLDRKLFRSPLMPTRVETLGVALVYNIDVGFVTPFVELGAARVQLRWPEPLAIVDLTTVASAGAGFDLAITQRLLMGTVVRYYALFDSALFDRPGYTTLQARLSVLLSLW